MLGVVLLRAPASPALSSSWRRTERQRKVPGGFIAGGSGSFKKGMANRSRKKRPTRWPLNFLRPQRCGGYGYGAVGEDREVLSLPLSPVSQILLLLPLLRPRAPVTPTTPHPGALGPATPLSPRDLQSLWVYRGHCHPTATPPQKALMMQAPTLPLPSLPLLLFTPLFTPLFVPVYTAALCSPPFSLRDAAAYPVPMTMASRSLFPRPHDWDLD